jgi:hypothetical protein
MSKVAREILGNRDAWVLDCGAGPGHVFEVLSQVYDVHGIQISQEVCRLYNFNTDQITV